MSRRKLSLVISKCMDSNKNADRNEASLIRMSATTRDYMGFNENFVEIWPQTTTEDTNKRMNNAMYLKIFKAFSSDIKKLRKNGTTEDELKCVGFVSSNTFQKICGKEIDTHPLNDVWIADDVNDTVIGADPEFLLFDNNGDVIKANRVISKYEKLGSDGAMAEVRPDPAISPNGLIKNIYEIFTTENLTKPIENFNWVAGCYFKDSNRDYPIGGHIHVGNPIQIAKIPPRDREHFFKVFNKIMDELIGLPMIKLDGANLGASRRSNCSMGKYGYYGEWRPCNGRLEYRTLSGMWLSHPVLAECVLGTTKAVIDAVFKKVAKQKFDLSYMLPSKFREHKLFLPDFNNWDEIPLAADMNCLKSSELMTRLLNNSENKTITKKFLTTWYNNLSKINSSSFYTKYIDGLFEILSTKTKDFKEFDKNIKVNWLENNKFIIDL